MNTKINIKDSRAQMSKIIRKPKTELYEDSLHELDYLEWIQEQVNRISQFVNIVEEINEDTTKRIVTPNKLYECASSFVQFYTTNIAFISIYNDYAEYWKQQADDIFDKIYLETKIMTEDKTTEMGGKYAKKAATMNEIAKETKVHKDYPQYIEYYGKQREFEKKRDTQKKFVESLGTQERLLTMLQRSMQTELKYLYLE